MLLQGGMLDLKIRLPPHIAQKLAPLQQPPSQEPLPSEQPPQPTIQPVRLWQGVPVAACLVCIAPLFWVVSMQPDQNDPEALEGRANTSGCLYLIASPLTTPLLLGAHLQHHGCRWFTVALALGGLLIGNTAAVLSCAGCRTQARLWLASTAIITCVAEKLLLTHKGNPMLLMLSTASAVVVCCLVIVAPFMPTPSMTYRCYQSTAPPMVWLFWQAACTAVKRKAVRSDDEARL
jgi:hypothetical protein